MHGTGVIQPSASELERLRQIEAAARSYIAAQMACWEHRRNQPEDAKGIVYWIAERDELAERSDEALVALVSLVGT